jgi:hypothetical protein
MILRVLITTLLLSLAFNYCSGQARERLEAINSVWSKFYQAFETLDYQPMAEIHSKELVRISGGQRISDYEQYIEGYKSSFKKAKTDANSKRIELRFFERINSESTASERGIYKLINNENRPDEQAYYGQFHVIFKKEDGIWKILMDYDSNPENQIGEKEYLASYTIDELDNFIKE